MSGSADRRALRRGSSSASKMFSVIMALVLAIGLMPLPAFAADDPAAGDSTANAEEPAGSGQGGEAPVVDSGNADEGGKTDAEGAQVDGSAELEGTDSPAGDAGDESEDGEGAASAADSGTGDPALPAASSMMRTQTVGDEGGVGDRALSEDAFLLIQDEKDAASSWDYVSGSVSSGMTLWANMYDSAGYSDTPVPAEDGWTYQWYACDTDSNDLDDYAAIDGQTSQSLVLTDDLCEQLAGKYLAVAAMADGARHIGPASSYTAKNGLLNANYLPGPVKRAGEVEIYSVVIQNQADGSSVFRVGDTAVAKAREKGAAPGEYIDADLLEFQWRGSDTKNGGYEDIENATSETLPIGESLEGKYLQCVVSSKVGSSTYERGTTLPVGAQDAVNITSVTLDRSGKVNVGDSITATAKAGNEDATASEKVVWSWYCGDSSYSTDAKIDGADSNELTVTDDLKGKYIEARADGGFGARDSSAAGPVVEPGAVELYQITVEGEAKIGSTLTATAYKENAYTEVDSSDKVTYQWQYADSKTTSDSAFKDIDGADGRTYVVDQSMAGKYLRVTATSDGTVTSTKKPSYYGSTDVDPLGPVTLAGQYTLADVELESSGQAGQTGNTITPTAMVEGSSSWMTSPAPSDAKLTFVWEYEAGDGSWKNLEAGYDPSSGVLVLSDDLVGKTLRVKASALDNEVESGSFAVIPSGTYDLLRMTTSPSIDGSNTDLLTGDSIDATVQAKRLDEGSYAGDVVSEGFSIQWYAGDARDGDYSEIEGADDVRLVIPEEAVGKYLKAVATSGSSSVEIVSANPVLDGDSLGAAVVGLEDGNWRPEPVYGVDSNMNDLVEAELASLGFDDVEVTTVDAGVSANLPEGATVDVSVAEGEGNGDITYFFMDPDDLTGWAGFSTYRTIKPTFKLTRDGETVEFTPSRTTSMPWDEAKVAQMLSEDADECLAVEYAAGDSAESVTQDMTLPYKLAGVSGGERSWSEVTWTSSNEDAVKITGYSWEDYEGNVTRAAADQQVTLTATIGVSSSGGPETTVQKEFSITVKGDPDKVAAEQEELQKKVEAAFDASKLTYSEDGAAIDPDAVTGDIQLPTTRALGIDGKDYSVEYSASNDSIVVNGYRANVYRPLPTQRGAETVELTVTVASKANAQISATKTISLAVAPLEAEDIRSELSLMDQAKEGYAAALLNGQDAQDVTVDLATFKKAYFAADGSLAWARTADEADEAGDGIETADLEPDDEMGSIQGHWFKSSDPGVIAHDTLLVAQPEYNTQVTVTSALSSEKYARYAERYADDPVWGETFAQLANQPVSATFTVRGATGMDDPNAGQEPQEPQELSVNVKVTGVAEHAEGEVAEAETWIPLTEVKVDAEDGATAWDVFARVLEANGYDFSLENGWCPYSITSPDGVVLGAFSVGADQWSYWSFLINGEYATSVYPNQYTVADGDTVELVYVDAAGVKQPEGDVVLNPDAEHPDLDAQWQGFAGGGSGSVLQDVSTATDGADLKWKASLLTDEERAAGASCASSDPLIIDGKIYVVSGSSTYDAANNWAETKSLARLQVLDPETGKVERETILARGLDSLCRMVYADGIIVIPLAGGYLQAVSASTLETLWVVDAIDGAQSVSSLEVSDGYVYVITVDSMDPNQDYRASSGTIRRVNLLTGALAGTIGNDSTGYYWAGGISVGSYFLVGDDSGSVSVYDAGLSGRMSSIDLGASVRSTLVEEDGFVYAVTNDGVLHKLELSAQGSLREIGSAKFADSSTSTPSVSGKTAYVGGGEADYTGVLAVIDLDAMAVVSSVKTCSSASAAGVELPAEVKSAPLVSVQGDSTYAYFTCNNVPGALYCYKLGNAEATMLYLPDSADQNYSMSSAFAGADGTLYFINDSGNLFALAPGDYLPSWGDDDDSGSGDGGPSGENGAGNPSAQPNGTTPLILAQGPTSQSDSSQDGNTADAEDSDDDDASAAEARALSAAEADAAGATAQRAGLPSWLPFVGIAVGVCGLGAALAWLLLARKRSADEEETR